MKIVFMGTPDFAVPSLRSLAGAGMEIAAVITRPDRPRGRGKRLQSPPVKEEALKLGLQVYQPDRVREDQFVSLLSAIKPGVIAVVAFGQILPAEILDLPPLGCINVHASLLPKYRGAAPIQRAVINGEVETGVTTMKMDRGLDTGDMLLQARTAISAEENFGAVHDRLSLLGAELLLKTLELLEAGKLGGFPQDHGSSTYAPPISRQDEIIDWNDQARPIVNRVRGLDPWPGARTTLEGKVLKVWRASVPAEGGRPGNYFAPGGSGRPGEILGIGPEGLLVQCRDGPLVILELQLEGGKRMKAVDFLRGQRINPGTVLGEV